MFNQTSKKTDFTGILYTRGMNKHVMIETFSQLAKMNKDIEILLHPGYFDINNQKFDYKRQNMYNFMRHKNRKLELKTLTDKDVIAASKKVLLVRFSDL